MEKRLLVTLKSYAEDHGCVMDLLKESGDISLLLLVYPLVLVSLSELISSDFPIVVFESSRWNKLHLTRPRKVSSHYQA